MVFSVRRITSPAYYNDFDPGACAWLEELIRADLIPPGEVDHRSILDVCVSDLKGFTQVHFFAGIGGWAYALRLAGWQDDRPVWTGSPPCQPFSVAGKQEGRDDARHLAPKFISLVGAGRPGMLFGEQVASAEVFGKAAKRARGNFVAPPQWAWLDDLSDRLEATRYAVGASDFPSAGVGAPHIRQRTFFGAVSHEWLAQSHSRERDRIADGEGRQRHGTQAGWQQGHSQLAASRELRGLADQHQHGRAAPTIGSLCDPEHHAELRGGSGRLVHSLGTGLEGHGGHGDRSREPGRLDAHAPGSVAAAGPDGGLVYGLGRVGRRTSQAGVEPGAQQRSDGLRDVGGKSATGPLHGFWADADWLFCRDGKWRPVEPGTFPLAHGVSGRVGLLRGYGNAINPHAAAEFIRAFTQAVGDLGRDERVALGGVDEDLLV